MSAKIKNVKIESKKKGNKEKEKLTEEELENIDLANADPKRLEEIDANICWAPEAFESIGKINKINSWELSQMISNKMKQTFHDFYGTKLFIVTTKNHEIRIEGEFYFEDNKNDVPDGKIKNLESNLTNNDERNLFYRQMAIQNRSKGKYFQLNDATKLLLAQFMYGGKKPNNPKSNIWKSNVSEVHAPANDPFFNNGERIFIKVTGIDLRRVLQELYGRTMVIKSISKEGGEVVNYTARAKYELVPMNHFPDGSFMIKVEQFDDQKVQEEFAKEHPLFVRNNIMSQIF